MVESNGVVAATAITSFAPCAAITSVRGHVFWVYSEHVDCLEELVAVVQGIDTILDAVKASSMHGGSLANHEARVMCTVEEHIQKSQLLNRAAESTTATVSSVDESASGSAKKWQVQRASWLTGLPSLTKARRLSGVMDPGKS
jgi:hypothetical protein